MNVIARVPITMPDGNVCRAGQNVFDYGAEEDFIREAVKKGDAIQVASDDSDESNERRRVKSGNRK